MKVLIADDEPHICTLLKYLIKWDELGLTLGGTFSGGGEVLDYLAHDTADILLCDIEMPGVDGLELMRELSAANRELKVIVVSGFRNFEYVRAALQYGACNYLLKPIDEKELNSVLRDVVSSVEKSPLARSTIMRVSGRLQLLELLRRPSTRQQLGQINQTYGYHFLPGVFQVLCAVFPGEDPNSDAPRLIMRMFEEILRPKLADFCQEYEFYREDSLHLCVLFNTESAGAETLYAALDGLLHSTLVELGCKTQNPVVIGVGRLAEDFPQAHQSYLTARQALCARWFAPERRILYAADAPDAAAAGELLTGEEKRELTARVQEIDADGVQACVDRLFRRSERMLAQRPSLVPKFVRELLTCLLGALAGADSPVEDAEKWMEETLLQLEACCTMQELRQRAGSLIGQQINACLAEKLSNVAAYAQQAKGYIDRHYQEPITLELLAGHLNINPTYLSVVFKNELHMNYSKYLTMVRMEKAKELLRQCDRNLTQIAQAVGYNRTAYFSSVFKAYTGIKPLEYRRLYQRGIGDQP